jgi:predicted MFS family arabinose efflux permease
MVVHTAHLPATAYGVIQSTLGVGKFVTVIILAGLTGRWATPTLAVVAYLLAALGVAIFAATPWYLGLIIGTFVFAVGNMLSYVVNATIVMQITPQAILGRVLGNRLVLVQGTRVVGALALGRLADAASPPVALWTMAIVSITGVLLVWFFTGLRCSAESGPGEVPSAARKDALRPVRSNIGTVP